MHFISVQPVSFLRSCEVLQPGSDGLMISISGLCERSVSCKSSAVAISMIWMRNPGSRFNTASSPLRMMADGSAIAMFNKVLIGITVLFFRELRSPARKDSLPHGCGTTGPARWQRYQTGRCSAGYCRAPDNI